MNDKQSYLERVPTISPDMHAILLRGVEPGPQAVRKMREQIKAACAAIKREREKIFNPQQPCPMGEAKECDDDRSC